MKRTRAKAVGLGLALLAGGDRAGGADPKPDGGAPSVLPQNVRAGAWTAAPAPDTNLIWLPARRPAPPGSPAAAERPAPRPAPAAVPLLPTIPPAVEPGEVGPKAASGADAPGPLHPVGDAPPDLYHALDSEDC